MTLRPIALIPAALASAALLGGCTGKKGGPPPPNAVPVTIARAERKDMPLDLRAIGHVEAYSTVAVKARVGGEVTNVHFREGQDVAAGALLFTIDPRPYEAALKQSQGDLARDKARLQAAAELDRRYEELVKKDYVTRDQYDQAHAAAAALAATVKSDDAAIENAKLNLEFCTIRSPISGRTGSLLVNAGNVVKANDDKPLVVLNQVRPVRVTFALPERYLADVQGRNRAGGLRVTAIPTGPTRTTASGKLSFIDNAVDAVTGTVVLKAEFANVDGGLWPGQFTDVVLTLGTQTGALVVPSEAVQAGQKGSFLWVVKADSTAETRPVTVERTVGGLSVLAEGVKPGETVVTDGQLRLVPGAKVEIKAEAKTEGSPEVKAGGAPERKGTGAS